MRTLINSKNFMVLKTFIAVHCKYIHYRLKKKEGGKVQDGWNEGGRRKGTIGMGVRVKKGRYKMGGMRGGERKVQ